ncbi:MAG: alpha/beta hydrolase [Clostridiales bacterium]|jgi:acetyl esterase/lipase|nr:alpha/beta hydrolase [Clostridiales bacterium]
METVKLYDKNLYPGCEKVYMECYVKRPSKELTVEPKGAVVIFPGGGYAYTSDREAEPIAHLFLAGGYNAFVVRYAVAPDCREINPLIDAAAAMVHLRQNAGKYNIDKNKIAVCGFSAGGHLAAYISTCWKDKRLQDTLGISGKEARPDATVLGYAVISGINNPHEGSIKNLLSNNTPTKEDKKRVSLEYRVDSETPPAFIWHTAADDAVNVTNSLDYAHALAKQKIPFELHVFPAGPHGISLATRETSPDWAKERYNSPYISRWGEWVIKWLGLTFGDSSVKA